MYKKTLIAIVAITGMALLYSILNRSVDQREPITITSNASYAEMSLDDLIIQADLIVIGSLDRMYPSRWNTPDGQLPKEVTVQTITPDKIIFTDMAFNVDQAVKRQNVPPNTIRIRSLGGIVGQDQMIVSGVASLETNTTYLLFLGVDTGSTADIDPGHYFIRGGQQGMYKITDGKAVSFRDEWQVVDLIAYIEKSLSGETPVPTEVPVLIDTPTSIP